MPRDQYVLGDRRSFLARIGGRWRHGRVDASDAVAELLHEVRSVDWTTWAIPLPHRLFDYRPDSVVPAFEQLARVRTYEEGNAAYSALLYAIGHNHSGTPYTAMSPAAPLLARLLPLSDVGAIAAMGALTDCALWSEGEPPFVGPDGRTHLLGQETKAALKTVEALARQWSQMNNDPMRRATGLGALEVLAYLP